MSTEGGPMQIPEDDGVTVKQREPRMPEVAAEWWQ